MLLSELTQNSPSSILFIELKIYRRQRAGIAISLVEVIGALAFVTLRRKSAVFN